MATTLSVVQIILSVLLIALVLLQAKGAGLGGIFGGGDSGIYKTRRGVELRLFQLTIVVTILFGIISLATVYIQK